ncbi:hypothetical protein BH23CHL2_BH23CHL2_04640 [soil metagenome]
MVRTIVIPLDQSENAERAIPVAQGLAKQFDAELLLVSVFEIPAEYTEWAGQHVEDESWTKRRWNIEAYLASVAKQLRPLSVSTVILTGMDPAVEIHDALSEMDDVILVISTQGRSGIKRLVLGSTASRIIQLATYPLIIVPADCEEYPESISKILLPLDGSSFAEHARDVTLELFTGEEKVSPSVQLLRVVDQITWNPNMTRNSANNSSMRRTLTSIASPTSSSRKAARCPGKSKSHLTSQTGS